jgi:type IV pilus assembly protein PilV
MLGLAHLQMYTLRSNQSALERGMAVVQTHSIVDAMHADRVNAINNNFDIAMDAGIPTGSTFAQISLAAWRNNLLAVLGPDASGAVDCNDALCVVSVRWNDERAGGEADYRIETQVQL